MKEIHADLSLFAIALIWGFGYLPIGFALETNGAFTIVFWQFILASLFTLPIVLKFGSKFDIKSILYGAFLGLFIFIATAASTFALKYTSSTSVAFIVSLYAIITPFVARIFIKEHLKFYSLIAVLISLFGVYLFTGAQFLNGKGELLALLCAFCFAVQITFAGELSKKANILLLLLSQFVTITILSFPFAFFLENKAIPVMDKSFVIAMIITCFLGTILAFFVQNFMQRYTSAAKASLIFTIEPVAAGILGYIFGERFSYSQIIGAIIILSGILLSELGPYIFNKKTK